MSEWTGLATRRWLGRSRQSAVMLALLGALGATGACEASSPPGSAAAPESGATAPDFTARDTAGKTLRLSDHLGQRPVLVIFWSTTCHACSTLLPRAERIARDNRGSLVVIGLAMDGPETIAEVPAALNRYGVTFPVGLDEDSSIAARYNPRKADPFTVVIDKSGRIVRQHEGYMAGDEDVLAQYAAEVIGGARQASSSERR